MYRQKSSSIAPIRFGILFLVCLSALGAGCKPASEGEKKEQPKAGALEYTRVQQLPGSVTLATLSNGLTVIVQENHAAPVATVRCCVKNTGSAFEGRYLGTGLSHLLEHLVSGGATSRRTEKETEQIVDRLGGATNAYTSADLTTYFIDCPARHVNTCIDLIADEMQHVVFEPAAFEREFKVVQRELADGEVDRDRVQALLLNETVYTEHPVRNPIIGYLQVLRRATREMVVDFYRERYVPNNQVFVVVGDVKTEDVLKEVARHWQGTSRAVETYIAMEEEPEQMTPREAVREMEGATYELALAWPTVELSNRDLYALDVAAYILGEGDSSRLVRRLKYEKQLVLSLSSASYTPHFVKGWFGIFATCRPETWSQANEEVLRDVYRLRDELVDAAELAKAKKQKASELVFGQQTVQQAAESLGRNLLSTGDALFEQKYVENIQKVTAEEIRDVARRYFVPGRLNRVIIAPPGGAPKAGGSGRGPTETAIRASRLPNGLQVLIKRDAHLPLVNIQAHVLGGCLVDTPETAGRSALVAAMLDKGTAKHTARQIADYFDSIGGKFATGSGWNTVYGSASTLREDFPKAAALMAECITRSTFPEDEFKKAQNLALGAIARRADDPQQEVLELYFDNLPASSPYHIIQGGKAETVKRLTAEDLRAYHAKYFVPGNMVVTVFGDIEPEAAAKLVQEHFGGLKADAEFKRPSFERANAIAKSVVGHKKIGKPTGMVLLGYPDVSILDEKEYAAMSLLDAIMSGYTYPGGWLHTELRGQGLVYYVHAFQLTGPAPGYLSMLAQTHPEKVDEVVRRIQQNVAKAKSGKITLEEFETAVEMVMSLHAQENTTIAQQARQAALDELYGLGYDYDKGFDERIKAVKLEDVVRAAKKCFDNYVLVTTSPAPIAEKAAAK